jgi:hypothetical protein
MKSEMTPRILYIHSSPLIDLRNKPYITDVDILDCTLEKKIIYDVIRNSHLNVNFRSITATVQNMSNAMIAGAIMIHYAGEFLVYIYLYLYLYIYIYIYIYTYMYIHI